MDLDANAHLVNLFGGDDSELQWPPDELSKELLGGKGFGLARMANANLPVPPGFTLTTEACARFRVDGWSDELTAAVASGLTSLERLTGRRLGGDSGPLLVSVRSGAAISMPGMMDTVLNVGMTATGERSLAQASGDQAFAADTHRRFLLSYAETVERLDHQTARLLADDPDHATPEALRDALAAAGVSVPTDPRTQVLESVQAVFRSWDSPSARTYREHEGIDHHSSTAATIQMMVFGNLGDTSGTGVAFTRSPSTGVAGLTGDFLVRAQGEDVVAGTHETMPLRELACRWPHLYQQLEETGSTLEHLYADMVDIEFTIERGRLWILQVRSGKRSPEAVFRTAVAMAEDASFPLDRAGAVERCRQLLDSPPRLQITSDDVPDDSDILAVGIAASPGQATGTLCTDIDEAVSRADAGEAVVLARRETSPTDVRGMAASVGLVTTRGGMVSHAAVVARAWGLPAVVGVRQLEIDENEIRCNGLVTRVGETVTVDGTNGQLLLGLHTHGDAVLPEVETIRRWAEDLEPRPSVAAAPSSGVSSDTQIVERGLVLKGMATSESLEDVIGPSARHVIEALVASGRVDSHGPMWTPTSTTKHDHAKADAEVVERHGKDFAEILDRFHNPNITYKELVTSWQVRTVDGETSPNDHSDAEYDSFLLDRLRHEIHPSITQVIRHAATLVPRLEAYARRLDIALGRLDRGDHRYMAHPTLDSYHTIWFELHEELLRLAGRGRAEEAAAGRA